MSEVEVLYSEVKFTRHGETTDGTVSSLPDPEVRTLSTQPSPELPGSQQQLIPDGRSKVTPVRAAFVVLGVLLAAAVVALGLTSYNNMELLQNLTDELVGKNLTAYKNMELLQNLTDELDAVRKNLTAYKNMELLQNLTDELDAVRKNLTAYEEILKNLTDKLVGQGNVTECEDGWEQHGAVCYYFSPNTNTMNWEDSRRACGCRGGTLVRIGSREEQEYLKGILREKMTHPSELFWIGLTDSEKEETWLWTDGSPLDPSLMFWKNHEPDNYEGDGKYPDGEDCAAMGAIDSAAELDFWFDQPCSFTLRHICDKPARTSCSKCI